jgi:hypothetical protein
LTIIDNEFEMDRNDFAPQVFTRTSDFTNNISFALLDLAHQLEKYAEPYSV